jgi:hypothetical protein
MSVRGAASRRGNGLLLIALQVAACAPAAPPAPAVLPLSEAQKARCEAQALAATAAVPSATRAAREEVRVLDACFAAYVYENRDETYLLLGIRSRPAERLTDVDLARFAGLAEACGAAPETARVLRNLPTSQAERAAYAEGAAAATRASAAVCAFSRNTFEGMVATLRRGP